MEKVECDMHQGDKVGASAVDGLTISKDKVTCHARSLFSCYVTLTLQPHWFSCTSN